MKIAVVFDNMIYGGIERVGISHIKLLKALGHDVDAYVLTPKTEDIINDLKKECSVYIKSFSRKECPNSYWVLTRRFSWGKYLFPIIYPLISLWVFFKKLFYYNNRRYDVAIAFSGHYNDLTFVADNFIHANKKVAWLHGALYQYVLTAQGFENLYKKIKNLVVLVDDAQEEVLAYHTRDNFDFNIRKIYNPIPSTKHLIDNSVIAELKSKYGDYLLMVSRFLYPHKDHYTVISSLKVLKNKYNYRPYLVFVGDGPERANIERFIKDQGVEDQVVLAGSRHDVYNFYASCHILVHASVAGEGLPTVLLEAMEYSKPVVCTDSKVGPREIIGDNEYGRLSRVKDEEDMAKNIFELVSNPEIHKHYSDQSSLRYLDFLPDEIIKHDMQLLNRLV